MIIHKALVCSFDFQILKMRHNCYLPNWETSHSIIPKVEDEVKNRD